MLELPDSQLRLIGLITVRWARLEDTLDAINDSAFRYFGGDAIEPELPKFLDRKLAFMRECHKKLPQLTPIRDGADALIDDIHATKQQRHDLIHGRALNAHGGEQIEVSRPIKFPLPGRWSKMKSVSDRDLEKLAQKVEELIESGHKQLHAMLLLISAAGGSTSCGD